MSFTRPVMWMSPSAHVGAVAALDPAVVEQLAGLRLVAEIALGDRGAAEFQHALVALAELVAGIVHDAHFVLLDRTAAGDDLDRVRVIGPAGSA